MKDIASIERRLEEIGARLHQGMTLTTDEDGEPAWIDRSGLDVVREIMKIERDVRRSGRETTINDFPPELQEKMRLWSRAVIDEGAGQVSHLTKDLCALVLKQGHR